MAAAATCVVLGVGIFGYMQRTASEAASEAPRVPACTPAEVMEAKSMLKCLELFEGERR